MINSVVSCLIVELSICKNHQKLCFQWPKSTQYISTTVHAMTKSFIPFCLAQDSESTDMNCLVF